MAVLVTGGAKRIGATIVRTLAAAGHTCIVHANTSTQAAKQLADEVDGFVITGDLSDPRVTDQLLGEANELAPVDHVIHNASTFLRKPLTESTSDDWDAMMRLHGYAFLSLARQAAAAGAKSTVCLLDTRITSHDPDHFVYLASKQVAGNLVRTLAKELAPMRVNGVAPGPVLAANDGSNESMDAAIKATALQRAGTPEEVAEAVQYLLGAQYVTGQTIFVDGGRHLFA